MKIDLSEPNSYTREIAVDIPWDELADDFERSIKKFSRRINMPGFRPGKIPRKVLINNFLPNIEADFIDDSLQKYYLRALDEKELSPINKAEVRDIHFKYRDNFSFSATFEIEPEITLPPLKKNSLKIQKTVYLTDDEDIELAIEDLRVTHAEIKTVEDGAEEGHFILADLQKLDFTGVPIIGEKMEKRYLKVGDGIFSGENGERLRGVKPGDTTRVKIPDERSGEEELYQVSIINVEAQILPEVNPDFIKLIDPDAEDESTWRERLKERIDRSYARKAEEAFDDQLSEALIEKVDLECPPSLLESYLDHVLEDVRQGKNQAEVDEEQVKETYRPMAERSLKWYLIRKSIIRDQNLKVTKEEINQEIQRIKDKSPDHAKGIEKYYKKPSNRSRIGDDLMEKKVLDYVVKFAKIKEVKIKTKDLRQKPEIEV